mmetsp:Transcript_10502/g.14497  ORF Transcript_10502/g.14497 Transcript_10502/m.14497 type:complete len:285 (+) Transcript_10502:158-1012(+)|eukprot:CAMPEP_0170064840 /NCGR_PEP_ID=MMETSP0019_2-20121128/5159_1 /TAXON_ID=98059 /ORGANISM="Dinobryon sp., Strain UTEXLB2267" /LENGTH=284 /DNA_ID=CAMNT_0010271575 /DNA_START=171 /DNA_END=1025 /DNA_ORIENTATION=+
MNFIDTVNGIRRIPIVFKCRCDNPRINDVTFSIRKGRLISEELNNIQNGLRTTVQDIFKIENELDTDIEVVPLDIDGKKCLDLQYTDSIGSIGVILKNDLLGRVIFLENKVEKLENELKEIRIENDNLKTTIIDIKIENDNLKTIIIDLKTKYEESNYKICLRGLIEHGRAHFWSMYGFKFMENSRNKFRTEIVYDASSDSYDEVHFPLSWIPFINLVKHLEPDAIWFLDELNGGNESTYSALSSAVHNINEEDTLAAVKYFNDEKYKALFQIVFGRTVDEVIA